jgi:hypothetical protein
LAGFWLRTIAQCAIFNIKLSRQIVNIKNINPSNESSEVAARLVSGATG